MEVFGSQLNLAELVPLEDDAATVCVALRKPERLLSARDAEYFDGEHIEEIHASEVTLPKTLFKLHSRLSARDLEFFETDENPIDDDDTVPVPRAAGCRDAEVFEDYEVAEVAASALPPLPLLPKAVGARDLEVLESVDFVAAEVVPPQVARRASGRDDEF